MNVSQKNITSPDAYRVFSPFITQTRSLQAKPDSFNKSESEKDKDENLILDPKKRIRKLIVKTTGITGASILVVGLGFAALSRKGAGWFSEKLNEILVKLKSKASSEATEQKGAKSFFQRIRLFGYKAFDAVTNAGGNFDHGKNTFGDWVIDKLGPVGKFFKKIKVLFSDAVVDNCKKKYKQAGEAFNGFIKDISNYVRLAKNSKLATHDRKYFEEIFQNNVEKLNKLGINSVDDLVKRAEELDKKLINIGNNVEGKIDTIDTNVRDIRRNFGDKTELFDGSEKPTRMNKIRKFLEITKKKYREALSEKGKKVINGHKEVIGDAVKTNISRKIFNDTINADMTDLWNQKAVISNSIKDIRARANQKLGQIDLNLLEALSNSENNTKFVAKIKKIRELFENFEKATDINPELKLGDKDKIRENVKTVIQDEIKNITKELREEIDARSNITGEKSKKVLNQINLLEDAVKDFEEIENVLKSEKGLMQEVRVKLNEVNADDLKLIELVDSDYHNNLTRSYDDFKRSSNTSCKSLGKAVNFEMDNLMYRLLDLDLGNWIFEVMGLISPLVILGNSINKSESKEEKISKTIKYGPVALGAMGGWVYSGLIECLNGPKAMMFGALSGLFFSKVGAIIDDKFYSKGREFSAAKSLNDEDSKLKIYKS